MNIVEKIISLYPELSEQDFMFPNTFIRIENAWDGRGDYIAKWEYPTLKQPTEQQLADIN